MENIFGDAVTGDYITAFAPLPPPPLPPCCRFRRLCLCHLCLHRFKSLSPSPQFLSLSPAASFPISLTRKFQSRDRKVTTAKEVKAWFEERFKTGNNRLFFSKLRYDCSWTQVSPAYEALILTPSQHLHCLAGYQSYIN
ncbi:hypothetical protein RJ640_001049 [Escallonia rubra]|uniref:Uncharacterized protein n=1 Tax=Escallonia rubra TaxID=112253 RepID=A0AA88RY53_9ASTE|nr:hypothetical protein RJ640_001049 [Escallonia rubra]